MNTKDVGLHLRRIIGSSVSSRAIRAGVLATRDRDQAMILVREAAAAEGRELYHYTVAARRRWDPKRFRFEPAGGGSQDPAELLRAVQGLHGVPVVIAEDLLSTLCDQAGDKNARSQLYAMLSPEGNGEGAVVVFLEPPESLAYIPAMLQGAFFTLEVPMPNRTEVREIALREVTAVLTDVGETDATLARRWADEFAPHLTGLTRTAASHSVRDALALERTNFVGALDYLGRAKREHLGRGLAMEILDCDGSEPPIGLDYLYRYLKVHLERIRKVGKDRARGILLIGPPGTGKSMLAKATGTLLGLPVVEFRISALMNSLLGATEARFDQAFQVIEAMAPNVVFIDEFEKAFASSGSENDGGTMGRVKGRFMSWLSDNEQPNFIVATSNNIERMGEFGRTITRPGRFDGIFFVDTPTLEARRQILTRLLEGRAADAAAVAAIAERVAVATERFTGADLAAAVNEAEAEGRAQGVGLSAELILAETKKNELRVQALYEEFAGLRRFAELHCKPAGPRDGR